MLENELAQHAKARSSRSNPRSSYLPGAALNRILRCGFQRRVRDLLGLRRGSDRADRPAVFEPALCERL